MPQFKVNIILDEMRTFVVFCNNTVNRQVIFVVSNNLIGYAKAREKEIDRG